MSAGTLHGSCRVDHVRPPAPPTRRQQHLPPVSQPKREEVHQMPSAVGPASPQRDDCVCCLVTHLCDGTEAALGDQSGSVKLLEAAFPARSAAAGCCAPVRLSFSLNQNFAFLQPTFNSCETFRVLCNRWTPHHLALVKQGHLNERQAAVLSYMQLMSKDNCRQSNVHTEQRS